MIDQPSYASCLSIQSCQFCVFDIIQPLLVTKSSKPFGKTFCVSYLVFGAQGHDHRSTPEMIVFVGEFHPAIGNERLSLHEM